MKKELKHNLKLQSFERTLLPKKCKLFAGVDEAGRGPLAGPVVASAVVIRTRSFSTKIWDSKKLTAIARKRAFDEILQKADVGIGVVEREDIDRINILEATKIAIKEALNDLRIKPEYSLLDGRFTKLKLPCAYQNVIKGDNFCFSIACASIVAKVVRDSIMSYYAGLYPGYGFENNRGYGTRQHLISLDKYGITPIHRRSFGPVDRLVELTKGRRKLRRGYGRKERSSAKLKA